MNTPKSVGNGRFQLGPLLGHGGISVVYEAIDATNDARVAVKLFQNDHPSFGELRARFARECKTMAALSHPHIARIYDSGEENGLTYLAMELLTRSMQDQVMSRGPLPLDELQRLLLQILDALQVVHAAGIIHRDVKPSNLLVGSDGEIRISDFGLAHANDSTLTRTGSVMGTLAYMPPEQRASSRRVDARSDLYAVGATAFALASGRVPPDLSLIALQPSLMDLIPAALRPLVVTACKPSLDDRYGSAAQMAEQVRAMIVA